MVRAQLTAIPRRREMTKSTLCSWLEYVFGQRVNTRVQEAMKFGNSEIFRENSGGGSTLGSRSCSWGPRDVCEEPALASSFGRIREIRPKYECGVLSWCSGIDSWFNCHHGSSGIDHLSTRWMERCKNSTSRPRALSVSDTDLVVRCHSCGAYQ